MGERIRLLLLVFLLRWVALQEVISEQIKVGDRTGSIPREYIPNFPRILNCKPC